MTLPAPNFDPLDDGPGIGRDGIPRDRWDRPLLIPVDGGDRKPYTSISTLSEALGDTFGLDIWDRRMIARGIGLSEDLAALAGAEPYNTGLGEPDKGAMKESGRRLDEIIERARDVAKAHQKRDHGTAFHGLTEPDNREHTVVPERMRPDVDSFWAELERLGIEIVATELFIVNEGLQSAGTFDHFVRVPGIDGLVVLDKKTGVYHPEKCRIQLACYAGGELYDKETDERIPFESAFGPVNQEIGITAHTAALSGKTVLYEEDLVLGRRAAAAAIWVRDYRKTSGRKHAKPFEDRRLSQ
jgi:hypothetical protein